MNAQLRQRVHNLETLFRGIEQTRMAGLPMLNRALQVEAIGFEPLGAADALGILLTPWFMNLVCIPVSASTQGLGIGIGTARRRSIAEASFDFIVAHEPGFGTFEACSLFSPVFEFADQPAARAMAAAVLADLRKVVEPRPPRRSFFLGRGASA